MQVFVDGDGVQTERQSGPFQTTVPAPATMLLHGIESGSGRPAASRRLLSGTLLFVPFLGLQVRAWRKVCASTRACRCHKPPLAIATSVNDLRKRRIGSKASQERIGFQRGIGTVAALNRATKHRER